MLIGAELNQLPRPVKFGAAPCAAATWNGAGCADGASPLAADRVKPASENTAMAADAASDRKVMAVSIV
jgi:hypothetical protein